MTSIRFLSVDDVIALHENTIQNEGGSAGIRDVALLESAVLMPQQQFGGQYLHEDIAAMAAAYLYHIAMNHPFVDGNKRAATLAALFFLDTNAAPMPEPDPMTQMTLSVASGQTSKDQLTDWMREQIKR